MAQKDKGIRLGLIFWVTAYVSVKSKLKHPRAFDVFCCPGGREFDELSFPRGGEFDHFL